MNLSNLKYSNEMDNKQIMRIAQELQEEEVNQIK